MKKLLLLVTFASLCYSLSAWPGQGKVHHLTMQSKVLGVERHFSIFLPNSYETNTDKKYPVLYLLHGHGEDDRRWGNCPEGMIDGAFNAIFASGECQEMLIVLPDAGSDRNGYFNVDGWRYEDYFFQELIPHIESNYRVLADKGHRAIAGLSMGGGGTTVYAQKHPEMFSSAYPMSALMTVGPSTMPANPNDSRNALTGSVRENDCVEFVKKATDATKDKLRTVAWFVDCGDDDFLLDGNVAFYQAMRDAKISCQFRVREGGHTTEYWYSALYMALPWASLHFDK